MSLLYWLLRGFECTPLCAAWHLAANGFEFKRAIRPPCAIPRAALVAGHRTSTSKAVPCANRRLDCGLTSCPACTDHNGAPQFSRQCARRIEPPAACGTMFSIRSFRGSDWRFIACATSVLHPSPRLRGLHSTAQDQITIPACNTRGYLNFLGVNWWKHIPGWRRVHTPDHMISRRNIAGSPPISVRCVCRAQSTLHICPFLA
jgi:hypothetical protein